MFFLCELVFWCDLNKRNFWLFNLEIIFVIRVNELCWKELRFNFFVIYLYMCNIIWYVGLFILNLILLYFWRVIFKNINYLLILWELRRDIYKLWVLIVDKFGLKKWNLEFWIFLFWFSWKNRFLVGDLGNVVFWWWFVMYIV